MADVVVAMIIILGTIPTAMSAAGVRIDIPSGSSSSRRMRRFVMVVDFGVGVEVRVGIAAAMNMIRDGIRNRRTSFPKIMTIILLVVTSSKGTNRSIAVEIAAVVEVGTILIIVIRAYKGRREPLAYTSVRSNSRINVTYWRW